MEWMWIVGALMTAFGTSVAIDCLSFWEDEKHINRIGGSILAFFIGFIAGPVYWVYQLTHMEDRRRAMDALKSERMEKRRALAQRDENDYQATVTGMYDAFDRMDREIEQWEKSLTDPPRINDLRIQKEHANWQAKFDEYDAPRVEAEKRRLEREREQAQIDRARTALQELRDNGPVLFESGAKATFYEHGRQLFNLGAKLIVDELDDIESNALDYYLQSMRRERFLGYGHAGIDYR